jgi:hypothetical protein
MVLLRQICRLATTTDDQPHVISPSGASAPHPALAGASDNAVDHCEITPSAAARAQWPQPDRSCRS